MKYDKLKLSDEAIGRLKELREKIGTPLSGDALKEIPAADGCGGLLQE